MEIVGAFLAGAILTFLLMYALARRTMGGRRRRAPAARRADE